jgi:hypothetical protein
MRPLAAMLAAGLALKLALNALMLTPKFLLNTSLAALAVFFLARGVPAPAR